MKDRAALLIERLHLAPHPEGGYFAEDHRSPLAVPWQGAERSAGTHIHYLLGEEGQSSWHRIDADEIWHLYEGGPLELHLLEADFSSHRLVRLAAGENYMQVVPAGTWQAAYCQGLYVLVGCTVFPGFEFSKFELLRDLPEQSAKLRERFAECAFLI